MRTSDPIGRWGPYDEQRRKARRTAALILLGVVVLAAGWYLSAVAGVVTAP